jgi:spermidine synthase
MLTAEGPTAIWRHSPIGIGRVPATATSSPNVYREWMNLQRRSIRWEKDGVESTVALDARSGYSFLVNGKSDGNARIDASTQVMAGLVGAVLHPGVKRAMVIGLGTGSSAGWLGALPGIERVDVAELEPAILHVAEVSALVNHDVLDNPRVHITIGDAREELLTTRETYDLIVSEPSNPYRAGVASLFTREYYQAIARRLAEGGMFLQWVQAYEVDSRTVRTVYGTLASVFPEVETFELERNDLLLVATKKKILYDLAQIRARLREEPFRSALLSTWNAVDAEGFFSHYVARSSFARAIGYAERRARNTDNQNFVEFGFARGTYQPAGASALEVRELAQSRNEHQPLGLERLLDWNVVENERVAFLVYEGAEAVINERMPSDERVRVTAYSHFLAGRFREATLAWRSQPREPSGPTELALLSLALSDSGDDGAVPYIERLRPMKPIEADAIVARLRFRQGKVDDAVNALTSALVGYRRDPWPWPIILAYALDVARGVATDKPETLPAVRAALSEPFAVRMFDEMRSGILLSFATLHEPDDSCADALSAFEPDVPWQLPTLTWRAQCYARVHHPNARRAQSELDEFLEGQPIPFGSGLGYVRAAP